MSAATSLGILILIQLFLGLASWVLRLATADAVQPELPVVVVTTAHVALGALILANALVLALQSCRIRPEESRVWSKLLAASDNP